MGEKGDNGRKQWGRQKRNWNNGVKGGNGGESKNNSDLVGADFLFPVPCSLAYSFRLRSSSL